MSEPSAYDLLREEVRQLSTQGIQLQTIIPVELPAEICPRRRKNQATGEWEPVLKNGALQPAITGKNPSFWRADGEPQLISHARPVSAEVLLERIAIAERLGKEIGLAVIPGGNLTSIDFDTKHYGSVQELEQDWMALVDRYPVLTGTRMERTPRGGVHVYVRVMDRMASWKRPGGGLHCNFTTEQGGPHRGEVLAGTRVSVCAPTRNGRGPYELINPEAAYSFAEVPDLASIGIYPEVKAAPEPAAPPSPSPPASERRAPTGVSTIPQLADLIGSKAQDVLTGGRPYGGDAVLQIAVHLGGHRWPGGVGAEAADVDQGAAAHLRAPARRRSRSRQWRPGWCRCCAPAPAAAAPPQRFRWRSRCRPVER